MATRLWESFRQDIDIFLSGQTPDIQKLVRDAPIIPESLDARDVVSILRDSPVHMGLVHDEYGTFQGVVTSDDILEAIVGSFHTEEGPAEPAAVKRDDGSYFLAGWMPTVEFADLLKVPCRILDSIRHLLVFCSSNSAQSPRSANTLRCAGGGSKSSISTDAASIKVLAKSISDVAAA